MVESHLCANQNHIKHVNGLLSVNRKHACCIQGSLGSPHNAIHSPSNTVRDYTVLSVTH